MKGHHYDFRELKNHTTSPVPRARGGRTEMRAAGNPDVFKEADGEEAYAGLKNCTPVQHRPGKNDLDQLN